MIRKLDSERIGELDVTQWDMESMLYNTVYVVRLLRLYRGLCLCLDLSIEQGSPICDGN